jgi:hypothetical protein
MQFELIKALRAERLALLFDRLLRLVEKKGDLGLYVDDMITDLQSGICCN